jgi:7,8-dihydropterin-6-yl-methyl-4-(beta-D-ribofuranosyl)aminobenzene 5'-phosphate synthase
LVTDLSGHMLVTTLVDNNPGKEGLAYEHGLSLGITLPGMEVLFDAGPSSAIAKNASILGYDLGRVDLAILSHGHYDHGGGLDAFFKANKKAPLFLKWNAGGDFYAERDGGRRYIGLDKGMLERNKDRLRWVNGSVSLGQDFHIITAFPNIYGRPAGNSALMEINDGQLISDKFEHELALVIKEEDGITIFTGCGHCGVLNMVSAAKSRFPQERIKAVVGGFHLISDPMHAGISCSSVEVRRIGKELMHLGCNRIYGGHCTGMEASRILMDEMGDAYRVMHTGLRIPI